MSSPSQAPAPSEELLARSGKFRCAPVEAPPHTRVLAALRGSRLLHHVDAATLEVLSRHARTTHLREGEPLWRAGEPADAFTIIQRGLVQVERMTISRKPVIVGIFGPRESVGTTAALGRGCYPADAIVASLDAVVVRIPRELVLFVMEQQPALRRAIQLALLDHTHMLTAKIDIVSAGSVAARICALLLHLSERFGDEQEDGSTWLPLSLSRVAFSRLICSRVETATRALSALRQDGVVHLSRDGVHIVDLEALRARAAQG